MGQSDDLIKHCPGIWLEGLRETTNNLRISGASVKIQNEYSPNSKQEFCTYIKPFCSDVAARALAC
jgi:hypothetical protein